MASIINGNGEEGMEMDDNDTPKPGTLGAAVASSGNDAAETDSPFIHIPPTAKEANDIIDAFDKFVESGSVPDSDKSALYDWAQEFYSMAMSRNDLEPNSKYVKKDPPRNAIEAKNWFNS